MFRTQQRSVKKDVCKICPFKSVHLRLKKAIELFLMKIFIYLWHLSAEMLRDDPRASTTLGLQQKTSVPLPSHLCNAHTPLWQSNLSSTSERWMFRDEEGVCNNQRMNLWTKTFCVERLPLQKNHDQIWYQRLVFEDLGAKNLRKYFGVTSTWKFE